MREGVVGAWATAVAAALLLGAIGAPVAIALLAAVFLPYVGLLALGPRGVVRLHLRLGPARFLLRVFGEGHTAAEPHPSHGEAILRPTFVLVPALAIIVAGITRMVTAAIDLGDRWPVPRPLVGVLALAILTSLPNAYTAIRLRLQGRGSALTALALLAPAGGAGRRAGLLLIGLYVAFVAVEIWSRA